MEEYLKCSKCEAKMPTNAVFCAFCGKKLLHTPSKNFKYKKRADGSGTIYRAKDHPKKPWRLEINHKFVGYFTTKDAAQKMLLEIANKSIYITDKFDMTLKEAYKLFSEDFQRRYPTGKIKDYDSLFKKFMPYWDMKLRNVDFNLVQNLIDKEADVGRSSSLMNKMKHLYSELCKIGLKNRVLNRNEADLLSIPARPVKNREFFSNEELMCIDEACSNNDTAKIIMILCYTGLRISELFNLRISDINLSEKFAIGGMKTKKGKNRMIPIHVAIREYVEYFFKIAKNERLLSGYEGNKNTRNFRKRNFYPFLEEIGLHSKEHYFHPHCCRYTFATLSKRFGLDNKALIDIMGHTEVKTTNEIYAQQDADFLTVEIAKIPKPSELKTK